MFNTEKSRQNNVVPYLPRSTPWAWALDLTKQHGFRQLRTVGRRLLLIIHLDVAQPPPCHRHGRSLSQANLGVSKKTLN